MSRAIKHIKAGLLHKEWLAWVRAGAPRDQARRPPSKQAARKSKRKKEAA